MVFDQGTEETLNVTSFLAMTDSTEEIINTRLGGALMWSNELGKSKTLENKRNRQRQWTPEKRAERSRKNYEMKPWLKSTGPKTRAGKARSLQNAWKHGFFSAEMRAIKRLLVVQNHYVEGHRVVTWENIEDLYAIRAKQRTMTLTLQQIVKKIKDTFQSAGEDISVRDIKMMIEYVTGHGAEIFITAPETPVTSDQKAMLDGVVARRLKGEPLTRILGVREFWGLEFEVTPDTLDPRPDTETLIEAVLSYLKAPCTQAGGRNGIGNGTGKFETPSAVHGHGDKQISIIDLGTGTGCIPISLLVELPNARAVAVDVSEKALEVARRNAEVHGVSDRIEFVQSDWFGALKGQTFDLIVSNPPYISNEVIQNLTCEVKNHDPFLSLSGGDSGLDCYEIIISELKNHLTHSGRAFLEIGYDQLESVSRLVDDSNLYLCDSMKDLAGNDRVVEISKRPSGDK